MKGFRCVIMSWYCYILLSVPRPIRELTRGPRGSQTGLVVTFPCRPAPQQGRMNSTDFKKWSMNKVQGEQHMIGYDLALI